MVPCAGRVSLCRAQLAQSSLLVPSSKLLDARAQLILLCRAREFSSLGLNSRGVVDLAKCFRRLALCRLVDRVRYHVRLFLMRIAQ
jgi:hypothetical protein